MNKKEQTIATYENAADRMALKFNSIGARTTDIEETFALCRKENPKVLEIGCGNGRDAKVICEKTNDYTGMDISSKFIEIARRTVPQGNFFVADIEDFEFPQNLDIIFAFASLLHAPKESLQRIIERAYLALSPGGVIRISVKYADSYEESIREDEFGNRTYYFYSNEEMAQLLRKFTIVKNIKEIRQDQAWVEILARK